MFGISFKTWQDICEMYFEIEDGSKKAYLQWFPFAKLTETDEELLKSEAFFYKIYKSARIYSFPGSDAYITKLYSKRRWKL